MNDIKDISCSISPQQLRLWFDWKLNPKSSAYNLSLCYKIKGSLNTKHLDKALVSTINQYSALRSYMKPEDDNVQQIIFKKLNQKNVLKIVDCTNENQNYIDNVINDVLHKPFDITEFPLYRFLLLKLHENDFYFISVIHHIIIDGKSILNFLNTLSDHYNKTIKNSKENSALELSTYVKNVETTFSESEKENARSYWDRILQHCSLHTPIEALKIPTTNTCTYNRKSFSLADLSNKKLFQYSSTNNISIFVILMSVFNALLSRYYTSDEYIIGYPVNTRTSNAKDVFGFFVNNIPLKVSILDNDNLTKLTQRIKKQRYEDKKYQNLPLSEIVKLTERDSFKFSSTVFSVTFGETASPVIGGKNNNKLNLKNLEIELKPLPIRTANGDLVMLYSHDPNIDFAIDYNEDKFSNYHIQQFIEHYKSLLNWSLDNPDQPFDQAPILTLTEKKFLIEGNNQTKKTYPEKTLSQLFLEIAKKHENHIALIFNDQKMSYGELELKSDQLACYLLQINIRPNDVIAICLQQGMEMIVAMLGILKVGAAYLPLDSVQSQTQLEFMLQDSSVKILITQDNLRSIFTNYKGKVIDINKQEDFFFSQLSNKQFNRKFNKTYPDDIAYVIYTSGSTGKPKGVLCTHRGIINLVNDIQSRAPIDASDSGLLTTSISFDASIFEIWSTLLFGASLHILSDSLRTNNDQLLNYLTENNISFAFLLPYFAYQLNNWAKKNPASGLPLKRLVVGAESVKETLLIELIERIENLKIINAYGPTEVAVISACYNVQKKEVLDPNQNAPIGKPVENCKHYVVDKNLNLVPVGVIGELCIASVGMARGYLNREELSKEKFTSNKFFNPEIDDISYKLMYRTGDLVKYSEDRNLYYMGRIDDQIKIRGYRVELQAIEIYIANFPLIKECAVSAEVDSMGNKFIATYIVTTNKSLNLSKLKEFLSQNLPSYMLPSRYTQVKDIPRNKNGKVDKKVLSEWGKLLPPLTDSLVQPRNTTEQKLKKLWSEILNIQEIGVYDNFFNLGGHSLLVTEILLRIRKMFSIDLPMHDFFENPTIAFLANLINTHTKQEITLNSEKIDLAIEDLKLEPITAKIGNPIKLADVKNILLTGATGFLGIHLLFFLLKFTCATIYCIVRSKDDMDAKKRILMKFINAGYNDTDLENRVAFISGDISQHNFGIDNLDYINLSRKIDLIYHAAANVHHIYNYEELRQDNVLGTYEVIKFCVTEKTKYLNYISTISSGLSTNESRIEETFIHELHALNGAFKGYAQSKLVAENLLTKAKEKGLPVTIYRPGWITGHSETGIFEFEKDHYSLLIKGCLQLGYAPDWKINLNINPVDFVSEFVVRTSLTEQGINKVYNLINKNLLKWKDLILWLQTQGFAIKLTPSMEWYENYLFKMSKDNALYPLLSLYPKEGMITGLAERDVLFNQNIITANTQEMINMLEMHYPSINHELLNCYFNYYIKKGFLKKNCNIDKMCNTARRLGFF